MCYRSFLGGSGVAYTLPRMRHILKYVLVLLRLYPFVDVYFPPTAKCRLSLRALTA